MNKDEKYKKTANVYSMLMYVAKNHKKREKEKLRKEIIEEMKDKKILTENNDGAITDRTINFF